MPVFGWRRRPLSTPSSTLTQRRASSGSTISRGAPIRRQNPRTTLAGGGTPPTGRSRGSEERSPMPIDTAFVGALHVEYLKKRDLEGEGDHPHHTLFQTSTIDALLEGNYDGDVSFAELAD